MKSRVLLLALVLAACDSSTPMGTDAGGGTTDAGTPEDAGPMASTDAGHDAGVASMCPPGVPMPEPWDCSTAEPVTAGDPITADAMTWTWVGFDTAVCMNGSATGIGVNINPGSTRLLILLEGGGACFDTVSCLGAANGDGYDESKFTTDVSGVLQRGILDRSDAANPFADWSFVYVPYCTGDVHGGQNTSGLGGRYFLGYQNFSWYLTRIIPTFPDVTEVVLAGRSAGGLGTVVNYPQTAEAFGCTPVHVLDDAGALLPDAYLRPCLQTTVRDVWSLDMAVPSDCEQCSCDDGGGLVNVLPWAAARYPDRRFAFLSSLEDTTMRQFFGFGYSPGCNFPQDMPAEDYTAGLNGTRALLSGFDNFGTFFLPGSQHTFTYQSLGLNSVGGTTIGEWLGQMVDGDPTWDDVGP
ncbi:MAG: pectin acetylesterase-family hydrolase [Sandaracinaceae bacterium]